MNKDPLSLAPAAVQPTPEVYVRMLEMLAALSCRNPRFFDQLNTFIEQHRAALVELSKYIPWLDAAVCDFLIAGVCHPVAAAYLVDNVVTHNNGNKIYHMYSRLHQQSDTFLSTSPQIIQLLFLPYYAFAYAEKNMKTQKAKTDKNFKLTDFVQDDSTEDVFLIFTLLKTLMLPYQNQRRGRAASVSSESEQILEALAELMTLLVKREREYDIDELSATLKSLTVTPTVLYKGFDEFLEFLRDNMLQNKDTAYYHHLLWFLDRAALFHDSETSTIAFGIKNISHYFDKRKSAHHRVLSDKIHYELLIFQQLYFCHLILMGSYFSDKQLMMSNIRGHVNRIMDCQLKSPLYRNVPLSQLKKERKKFDGLFKQFIEMVHSQPRLFIAEAMNFQNTILKFTPKPSKGTSSASSTSTSASTSTSTVSLSDYAKITAQVIPNYLLFMQILLANLTPAEIDTLCFNPDYCLELYRCHLLKIVDFQTLPLLTRVDDQLFSVDPTNTEIQAHRLDDTARRRLSVKCWLYAINYQAILTMHTGKNALTPNETFNRIITPQKLEAACNSILNQDVPASISAESPKPPRPNDS